MASRRRPDAAAAPDRTTAFESEALSYLNTLYAMALRLTANSADAEDLVQETYLKAFRSHRQFQPGTNLKAWLFTILHNTFLNTRRNAGRETITPEADDLERAPQPEDVENPEQILLRKALDTELKAALDSLPEIFREAVWLRDVEDLSYAEIAQVLQVPLGTVMSRISRGRRLLHARLTGAADVGAADTVGTPK